MFNKKKDILFSFLGAFTTLIGLFILAIMLFKVLYDGWDKLNWHFLTNYPSRKPEEAGILSAWIGTVWITLLTALLAVPIGIGAGIYLEEYAQKNKFTDFIEINIANLAGVPSIIYGLLGLGLFVHMLHLDRSVLAGGATLALLILPIIILATREGLRNVPSIVRDASYALGATKWQTVRHQVLPIAFGNILTGIILAMSRAIGETAPLITIGALTYVPFVPKSPINFSTTFPFISFSYEGFFETFTVLPVQIFQWISRPQKGFLACAAAGIVVLLAMTLILNALAVYLRHRNQG